VSTNFDIYVFNHYHWFDTSASGLLVPEGMIRPEVSASSSQKSVLHPPRSQCFILPEVSASALTWFVRYIYYGNLQFLNNVIINKTEVLLPQAYVTLADFGYPV
jgi:hypothetical protein